MRGQLFIVKQLEAYGADLEARDNKQRRPLEIAEANRQTQVANYLKSARDINKCQNFIERQLPNIQNELQFHALENMRNNGRDVRHHVIQNLRDLESMIHDLLFEVGTTPVMQATSSPEGVTPNNATGTSPQTPRANHREAGSALGGPVSGNAR